MTFDLYAVIYTWLFTSQRPLTLQAMQAMLVAEQPDIRLEEIEQVILKIKRSLKPTGLVLKDSSLGYRIQVAPNYLDWVHKLFAYRPPKLSRAVLETLAIIAHKQPITRAEIEAIRGVAVSSQIMAQLKQQEWVKELGVKEVPGYPTLWGTTPKLVEDLGLASQQQLVERLDQIVQQHMALLTDDAKFANSSGF